MAITEGQVAELQRVFRGKELARRPAGIRSLPDGRWWVESAVRRGEGYHVSAELTTCTCPDFQRRNPSYCKHILACRYLAGMVAAATQVRSEGEELAAVADAALDQAQAADAEARAMESAATAADTAAWEAGEAARAADLEAARIAGLAREARARADELLRRAHAAADRAAAAAEVTGSRR